MINMLRIDERLIHGQVAVAWIKVLNITHIVVINNDVVKNEVQKVTLKMAVPEGVKLAIKDVKDGIELLKDKRTENMKVLVVVKNIEDALAVAEQIKNIDVINVGNYGLLPCHRGVNKKEISKCLCVDEEDIKKLKKIGALGIPFQAQLTPNNTSKDMNKLLRGE